MANGKTPPTNEIRSTRFPYDMVAWSTEKTKTLIQSLAKSVDALNEAKPLEPVPEKLPELEKIRELTGQENYEDMMPRGRFDDAMWNAFHMAFTLYGFAIGDPDFHPKCSQTLTQAALKGGSRGLAEEARRLGIDDIANALERDLAQG